MIIKFNIFSEACRSYNIKDNKNDVFNPSGSDKNSLSPDIPTEIIS